MARIRTIKPSFWASEKLGKLSTLARLNFVGLISMADDEGRGRSNKRFLIGELHAYSEAITESLFSESLTELSENKFVAFYEVGGCQYYALPGWREHQYIEKPRKSELPQIPSDHPMFPLFFPESSPTNPQRFPVGMEGKGREWNGKERKDAPSASDFSGHRLQCGTEFKGVFVTSLTLETAKKALFSVRPNAKDREALVWWISEKQRDIGMKRECEAKR